MSFIAIIIIILVVLFFWGLHIIGPKNVGVVQKMGKYVGTLSPGPHWLMPVLNHVDNLDVATHPIALHQVSIYTKDSVNMTVSANLMYHITDPNAYLFENTNTIQSMEYDVRGHLRSILGNMDSSDVIGSYQEIDEKLFNAVGDLTDKYGVKIERVNLDNITPDPSIQKALNEEKTAKQEKKAQVTEANARATARVTKAQGDATAMETAAKAKAYQISKIQNALNHVGGNYFNAQSIQAFSNLANNGNIVVVPSKDASGFGSIPAIKKLWDNTPNQPQNGSDDEDADTQQIDQHLNNMQNAEERDVDSDDTSDQMQDSSEDGNVNTTQSEQPASNSSIIGQGAQILSHNANSTFDDLKGLFNNSQQNQ